MTYLIWNFVSKIGSMVNRVRADISGLTWAANRLRDGNKEVVGVLVHRRERLQEDVPVGCHPKGSGLQNSVIRYFCFEEKE